MMYDTSHYETGDRTEKASEHSADSAIDLNELEVIVADDTEPQLSSLILPSLIQSQLKTQASTDVSKLGVDSELARGSYPSQEKLCDEINSEPRIYESSDDLEMTWLSSLALVPTIDCIPTWSPSWWHNSNTRVDQQPLQYSVKALPTTCNPLPTPCKPLPTTCKPIPTTCKPLYGKVNDNHPTDYGLAMLKQRPYPVCGEHIMYPQGQPPANGTPTSYQYPYTYKQSANIAWKTDCSFPVEIIHV
ncbi:hypothetical protein EB796_018106 [Bugula neritina]|uniref:Uncharacterized protein n=1 Tax=Bugula neritina TaxID=10212 RepID=A0A7J7JBE6_BUGNE|nr:hypothetical protein EB796_018106 [Bugula neritina]